MAKQKKAAKKAATKSSIKKIAKKADQKKAVPKKAAAKKESTAPPAIPFTTRAGGSRGFTLAEAGVGGTNGNLYRRCRKQQPCYCQI